MTIEAKKSQVLVSDFDGTMTRRDFYRIALERLVPAGTHDYWGDYLAGRMTHFAALQAIFSLIRADEEAVMAAARAMDIDPALGEATRMLRDAGWSIVIASAGCEWYISRLLADQGAQVTLHSNPGYYDPAHGLVMRSPEDSPFFSSSTGIDKEAVTRHAVANADCVAFAGDGRPDLPAALLVPPRRRFARGWLADELTRLGLQFRKFERWSEIADVLLGEEVC